MPRSITIMLAKIAWRLSRFFGNGGTALPGLLAERLDPNILAKLARGNFKDGIIIVTGTNGKTTTSLLIANLLQIKTNRILHNHGGSNLMRGVITTIIEQANWRGQVPASLAVFEVDENAFVHIVPALKPTDIVVTNLFRDQLDRYGELDTTAKKLATTIANTNAQLYLNADDPLVASLGYKNPAAHYFGVNDYKETQLDDAWSADSVVDPFSGRDLVYQKRYFSHIGIYHSASKGFARPKPELAADKVILTKNNLKARLRTQEEDFTVYVPLSGFYNIYNVLAASVVAQRYGLTSQELVTGLSQAQPAFGRAEVIKLNNRHLQLLLIKNPVGFNQIIENYLLGDQGAEVLIIINDNLADGRDISWLWDAAVEALASHKGKFIVSGQRADDMALRLKYANVENITIISDVSAAITELEKRTKSAQTAYILPTYTAMLEARGILAKKANLKEYWQ